MEVQQNPDPFKINEKLLLILVGTATKTAKVLFLLYVIMIHSYDQNVESTAPGLTN